MSKIICPYCFDEFEDDQVHFRSEIILDKKDAPWPAEYEDMESYIKSINRKAKNGELSESEKKECDRVLEDYDYWEYFCEADDDVFIEWWSKFGPNGKSGQTTEKNPADDRFGIKGYMRPIISLNDYKDKFPNGKAELIRDNNGNGIVSGLKICDVITKRRVCPHCHNPLPEGYGKYPVKFIAVVGITAAGKTVYLSQLLKNMDSYAAKVGLSIDENSSSIKTFIKDNPIKVNTTLPAPTSAESLQQPLFYDLTIGSTGDTLLNETFVMYDVSGESFEDVNTVDSFAPFVEHADGVILLVSPNQFEVMEQLGVTVETKGKPKSVLSVIRSRINHGDDNKKINLPVAVCISQADRWMSDSSRGILDQKLIDGLSQDTEGVRENNRYKKEFNAIQYNPIGKELNEFLLSTQGEGLASYMYDKYSNYAWFAFSALGCDVIPAEDGNGYAPRGPILPKHVEDPLLWMFYRFGYIGSNERVFSPCSPLITCPSCGENDICLFEDMQEAEIEVESVGLLGRKKIKKEKISYNASCNSCDYKWIQNTEIDEGVV